MVAQSRGSIAATVDKRPVESAVGRRGPLAAHGRRWLRGALAVLVAWLGSFAGVSVAQAACAPAVTQGCCSGTVLQTCDGGGQPALSDCASAGKACGHSTAAQGQGVSCIDPALADWKWTPAQQYCPDSCQPNCTGASCPGNCAPGKVCLNGTCETGACGRAIDWRASVWGDTKPGIAAPTAGLRSMCSTQWWSYGVKTDGSLVHWGYEGNACADGWLIRCQKPIPDTDSLRLTYASRCR